MTPKSLLRERSLFSNLSDLSEGQWYPIIDDTQAQENRDAVRRLILCSGKIYVDLVKPDIRQETTSVAIARLEQLYTFPSEDVLAVLNNYPNLEEVIWLQEEPQNMGAWTFVAPHLERLIDKRWPLRYLGRPPSASPAEGSTTQHTINQAVLVSRAYTFGNHNQ